MKKILFVSLLAVLLVGLMSSVAVAGGWTTISYTNSHDPNDTTPTDSYAYWNADEAVGVGEGQRSPHGDFSASTNRCRVCHAVHLAGTNSWRLLADGTSISFNGWSEDRGTSRASECNFCHGAAGATTKRPYRPKTYNVRGEHTIGATVIPDATDSTAVSVGGLSCGNCHTVHGANDLPSYDGTTTAIITEVDADNSWTDKILKLNPNSVGADLAQDTTGAASELEMTTDGWATLSNFCSDCHNKNQNWGDTGETTESARINPMSHIQGPDADGDLEVYGVIDQVAGYGTVDGGLPQTTANGCRGCHAASNDGNVATDVYTVDTTSSDSAWPHQTKGTKLLFDSFTEDNKNQVDAQDYYNPGFGEINDATRIVPKMDALCAKCHRDDGNLTDTTDTQGVGVSF